MTRSLSPAARVRVRALTHPSQSWATGRAMCGLAAVLVVAATAAGTMTGTAAAATARAAGHVTSAAPAAAGGTPAGTLPRALRGWGFGADGQVGDGSTRTRRLPVKVRLPRGTTVTSVRAGCEHAVALTAAGQVLAWGLGKSGQLGNGSKTSRHIPVRVRLPKGVKVTAVRAGCEHSLALTSAGHVLAWGFGGLGELGTGSKRNHLLPVRVAMPHGARIKSISAGCDHNLALTTTGHVLAWGFNSEGQVGVGGHRNRLRPVMVHLPAGTKVKAITAGCDHSLVTTATGQVFGWGRNEDGELGDGSTIERDTPVLTRLGGPATPAPVAMFAGCRFTIELLGDGTLLATGDNQFGQLGDATVGGATDLPVPALVPNGTTIKAISAGCSSGLALATSGRVLAWGDNSQGQVGIGGSGIKAFPVRVHLGAGVAAVGIGSGPGALTAFAIVVVI